MVWVIDLCGRIRAATERTIKNLWLGITMDLIKQFAHSLVLTYLSPQ